MKCAVMPKVRISRRGFTLTEVVVAVAILGLVMATVSPFLTNFVRHTTSGTLDSMMMQESRWAMDLMQGELMYANAGFVTITGGTSISFFTPAETSAVEYSLVNNEVCRTLGGGVKRPITDAGRVPVTVLTFSQFASGDINIILITMTVQRTDMFGMVHNKTMNARVYALN